MIFVHCAMYHDWFFTPQDELHGCAPRELIWAEQKGEPKQNVAMTIQAMEQVIPAGDEDEMTRFRHHRDFILALARVVHPGARLWLQGWLDAVAHGAFARAGGGGEEVDNVF